MASDAIIVGEGWLSEHYFTTDAKSQSFQSKVLARRKEWDDLEKEDFATTRTRFSAERQMLESSLATLEPGSADASIRDEVYAPLREVLGFAGGGLHFEVEGPLTRVSLPGLVDGAPLALVEARPLDTVEDLLSKDVETLLEPWSPDEETKHPITSVSRLLSTVFVEERGPKYVLVFAGKWLLVAERERWPEGRYLAVNLQAVVDRNDTKRGGEVDRALTCVSAESLAPDAEGDIWWDSALEESIKHTVGVSQDLREGVRLSIEIIANDVVRRRQRTGLAPLPTDQAQELAKQSLRFLYRILFLLYAEASPELEVLPVGLTEYEQGYGLDRLRELTLVTLGTEQGENGTHLYESLAMLFHLVDQGHDAPKPTEISEADDDESISGIPQGLLFNSLRADLFLPEATSLIDEVKLSNSELQNVLQHLLLSKEQKGRDRGFISYADLGINQLGAVYEGLMSYTGFFADTDLYEVAKDGDATKGSWVVPVERSSGLDPKDFVKEEDAATGEMRPRLHEAGTFVFRLAGRERQQSASYYTPEVLTRFTVSQALEELLDQDGRTTTAEEILDLTVCEPALGSGAFAIEAVRQLAEQYLRRRQEELGERIDPDAYPRELQKVKASIALHQIYGVDLNSTAVELAEISLWLDTMSADLQAPWFGLHLRRGNSLIGARRAVYSEGDVMSKAWLKSVPRDVPITQLKADIESGSLASGVSGAIHHFLLPAAGWGSAVDAKEAKELAPEALAALREWRRQISAKPSKKQLAQLQKLSYRAETLWQFALRRLEIAEREIRRHIPLWNGSSLEQVEASNATRVTREQIEKKLADADGAYQRLRRVMDAWCALWFWPLTSTHTQSVHPPNLDEWIAGLTDILGTHFEVKKVAAEQGQTTLGMSNQWVALGDAEEAELILANAKPIIEALNANPWLAVAERVADEHGFFHWELDFATVFARGGFGLQVGNPPWVRPSLDVPALLAEGDPWWQLTVKPTQQQVSVKKAETLARKGMLDLVVEGAVEVAGISAFLGAESNYPHLTGLQPDLYRCFMERVWAHMNPDGIASVIHPESHFTEERAGLLREATYRRLRRHWHFLNYLGLFEISNNVSFGVHVYGNSKDVNFASAASLYHPDTLERSLNHDGTGEEPGLRDPAGNWDQRPHQGRVTRVTFDTLRAWHGVLEEKASSVGRTRMLYAMNSSVASVIGKLSNAPRMSGVDLEYSNGWHETSDRAAGVFDFEWGAPGGWESVILQGSHVFVENPFYKAPNPNVSSSNDWSLVDLESLGANAVPKTTYKPLLEAPAYDAAYTHWGEERLASRNYYRVAWRNMAGPSSAVSERTLIPSIIPPGAAHVNGITSFGGPNLTTTELVILAGQLGSLVHDLLVRVVPKSTIPAATVRRLPAVLEHPLVQELAYRALRLNCLTAAYSELWAQTWREDYQTQSWAGGFQYSGQSPLGATYNTWTVDSPIRRATDRRQALLEIDVIVALMVGLSVDEICTIYRTQFPVLHGFDVRTRRYDAKGRLVPSDVIGVWRLKQDRISEEERTATNPSGNTYTYELPFVTLDREADMRQAYAHFERILKERS